MRVFRKEIPTRPWRIRFSERRLLLVIGDFLAATVAFVIALYNWGSSERFIGFSIDFIERRVPPWFFLFPLVWMLLLVEIYDVFRAGDWRATFRGVAAAALIGFGLYLVLYFYYSDPPKSLLPRRGVATFLVVVASLTLLWRWFYIQVFTLPQFSRRVLIAGGGNAGKIMIQALAGLKPPPFILIGIVDDDVNKMGTQVEGIPVIGSSESLGQQIQDLEISDIIVAISGLLQSGMFKSLLDAQEYGVEISRMPKVYEQLFGRIPIRILEADWILRSFVDENSVNIYYELIKRLLDIIGGLVGLVLLLLLYPIIGLAIFIDDGQPILYSQVRLGKSGKEYRLLKFRTMRRDAEADGRAQWAKEEDTRATRIGRILRKSHLDELPQFINVIKGEMSLVGPRAERPELIKYFEGHIPFYRARLLVKPGLTGWAQVNYGYAASIEETTIKLEYDLFYIKDRSIFRDLLILLRTPSTVFGLRGR